MLDGMVEDIEGLLKNSGEDSKDKKSADANLKEAEDLVKQLKIEVNTVTDKAKKTALQTKIRTFESQIGNLKRSSLLEPDRVRVQTKAEKAEEGLDILMKAHAELAESEKVGAEVLVNLDKQKSTIINSKNNLKQVQVKLDQSNGLLNQMSKWWRG